jgi:hypothetical protein
VAAGHRHAGLDAFRTLDNGLVLEASQLELPFTTDAYRAGQIAQIEMKRSRFGIVVTLTATIAAMALEVGDVVPVTHATFGWSAKSFRVLEIELLSTTRCGSRSSSTTRRSTRSTRSPRW